MKTYTLFIEDEEYNYSSQDQLDKAIERCCRNLKIDGYTPIVTTPNYPLEDGSIEVYIDAKRR